MMTNWIILNHVITFQVFSILFTFVCFVCISHHVFICLCFHLIGSMAFWILNKINCSNKQFNWKTEITKIHAHRLIKTMKGGVLVYDKDASMHVEKYSFENQLHVYLLHRTTNPTWHSLLPTSYSHENCIHLWECRSFLN